MPHITESVVEDAALIWLAGLGYDTLHAPDIAPNEPAAERDSYADVVLQGRLRSAIDRLNPGIPSVARDEALRKVLRSESASLIENNRPVPPAPHRGRRCRVSPARRLDRRGQGLARRFRRPVA